MNRKSFLKLLGLSSVAAAIGFVASYPKLGYISMKNFPRLTGPGDWLPIKPDSLDSSFFPGENVAIQEADDIRGFIKGTIRIGNRIEHREYHGPVRIVYQGINPIYNAYRHPNFKGYWPSRSDGYKPNSVTMSYDEETWRAFQKEFVSRRVQPNGMKVESILRQCAVPGTPSSLTITYA